jgi:hypothetical protein
VGKAVLKFQVPVEINCPFLYCPKDSQFCCSRGSMHNNLEYCVNNCTNNHKSIIVNKEESSLKRGDKNGIKSV